MTNTLLAAAGGVIVLAFLAVGAAYGIEEAHYQEYKITGKFIGAMVGSLAGLLCLGGCGIVTMAVIASGMAIFKAVWGVA